MYILNTLLLENPYDINNASSQIFNLLSPTIERMFSSTFTILLRASFIVERRDPTWYS